MNLKTTLAILASAAILWSCSEDKSEAERYGTIQPQLRTSTEVAVVTKALVAPAQNAFALTLASADGSYTQSWASIDDYPVNMQHVEGSYTATASCGSPEEEGFDKPCFAGSKSFAVTGNATTPVVIECALANTGINVAYTEVFKKYFATYSATVTSSTGSEISFAGDESRTAYVKPGDFAVKVSYAKSNGTTGSKSYTVTGVEARQLYNITFNVNDGAVGGASISIVFNSDLPSKDLEIDLGAE